MSLVPDYDDSSSSTSSNNSDDDTQSSTAIQKLPKPEFLIDHQVGNEYTQSSSVFKNPFIQAENAKKAILEKHVKMVNSNSHTINGKKICWNYRKGRCRFGHNCKYAHDSDLQKTDETIDNKQQTLICQQNVNNTKPTKDETKLLAQSALIKHKRKRPGLTQGLIPGKKVMKIYANQKTKKI